MKQFIYAAIWIFIWLPSAKGQVWRDSLNVGQQAFQSGDYKRAMKLFRDAQDLAPDHINILDLINQSAYKSQNYQDAIKGYAQAAQNAKSAQEQSRAHYNLGNAHFRNNDVSKAIESYKEALRKDPTNEKARHNLAYAMHKKQNDQNNKDNNDDKKDENKNNQNENKNNKNQDDQEDKENDGKNDKQDKKNEGKGDQGKGQPGKGQLSPDMTEQLLDALERSEGQTKAKMDKQKDKETKGQPRKQKDW